MPSLYKHGMALFRLNTLRKIAPVLGIENEIIPLYDEARGMMNIGAFEYLFPERVRENAKALDLDMGVLDADIKNNVTRKDFVAAWTTFYGEWKAYFASHSSTASILAHGTGAVWRQVEDYRSRLNRWWNATRMEVPGAKMVMTSASVPGSPNLDLDKPEPPFWTPERAVLATVFGLAAAAGLGFATYQYFKFMRHTVDKAEKLIPEVLPTVLANKGLSSLVK